MTKYIYSHADGDYVSLNDVTTPEDEAYDAAVRAAYWTPERLAELDEDFAEADKVGAPF